MSKAKRKNSEQRAEGEAKQRPAKAASKRSSDKRPYPERAGERPRARALGEKSERRGQASEGRVRPRGHQAARGERAPSAERGKQRAEVRGKDEPWSKKSSFEKRASRGERGMNERSERAINQRGERGINERGERAINERSERGLREPERGFGEQRQRREEQREVKRAFAKHAGNGASSPRAGEKYGRGDRTQRARADGEPRRDPRTRDHGQRTERAFSQERGSSQARGAAGRGRARSASQERAGARAGSKGGQVRERPAAQERTGAREHTFSRERAQAREHPSEQRGRGRERPATQERPRGRERPATRERPRGRERTATQERPRGRERTAASEGFTERPARGAERARPAQEGARPYKRLLAADATRTRERPAAERAHAHKRPLAVAGPRVPKRAAEATRTHATQDDESDDPSAPHRFSKRTPVARAPRPSARSRPAEEAAPSKAREVSEEPHPGLFMLTTRVGSEQDLVDELALLGVNDPAPRILAPALVLAPKVPKRDKRPVELTFARQGFPIVQSVRSHDLEQTASRIARSLRGQLERAQHYALHVWVPDSDLGNPLSSLAEELEAKLAARLQEGLPQATRVDDASLRRLGSIPFAQVCLIDPERTVAGVTYSNAALSLAKGGRTRVRVTGHFPSRAARKLVEALAWLGVEPSAGDVCVDLGAAPGGWTYVLADRRARVIAVDPAKLKPEILAMKGVRHVQESAFTFAPEGEVDWLFCDMAWRPLEAAALLAKWGRKHWARMLVANIKLPMKKKAELLARVRHILENEGQWKHVRTKQLYHDRDEITLTAHLG